MEEAEVDLIKRAQSGDKKAFESIMNKYGEKVMSLAYKFTGNYQDAEDLYQDTFLKIYSKIDTFRFQSEFYTWLYRIMANQSFNYYKKNKRTSIVGLGENDYLWEIIPSEDSVEIEDKLSLKEEVDNALMELPNKQRMVFILKYYEGKKIKDIALLLDCAEGTVKKYLFRATNKLRTLLTAT
jgi:RNA polymerase sigma-70 factor (ECF subfamily)